MAAPVVFNSDAKVMAQALETADMADRNFSYHGRHGWKSNILDSEHP